MTGATPARRRRAGFAAVVCLVALALAPASAQSQVRLSPARPGATQAPNPAGLTLEISPGPEVAIGQNVWFKASASKPGYLVLIDVDPVGKLTQIYPNLESLRIPIGGDGNSNRIRPGRVGLADLDPHRGGAGGTRCVYSYPVQRPCESPYSADG